MSNSVNLSLDVTKTGIQNPLIKVRQGDGGFETLRTTVTANGEPMDLQGWTITFMGTTAGNHKIVDGNVTLVEAPNGIFDYTPSKAWGMDIGDFKIAYFKFVKGDGSASSANFRVSVIEAVDLTQEEAQHYISVVDAAIAEVREHLESSLADVSSSVAATSTAVSSMNISVSSAVSEVNSAASNASSVATSAVDNINGAADVYVKKTGNEDIAGDKTFTGNSIFTNLIDGYTKTKIAPSTDVNLIKTSGKYHLESNYTNIPFLMPSSAVLTVETNALGTVIYQCVFSRNIDSTNGDIDLFMRLNIDNHWTPWRRVSQDQDVVHNTGTETIAGDKTFTGKVMIGGGNYQTTASATTNYFGSTISFVRIGNQVTFTSSISSFKSDVAIGATSGVIPVGFRPALQQNVNANGQAKSGAFFSFDGAGAIYSYTTYSSGTQPRVSGSYITTDAWPV